MKNEFCRHSCLEQSIHLIKIALFQFYSVVLGYSPSVYIHEIVEKLIYKMSPWMLKWIKSLMKSNSADSQYERIPWIVKSSRKLEINFLKRFSNR